MAFKRRREMQGDGAALGEDPHAGVRAEGPAGAELADASEQGPKRARRGFSREELDVVRASEAYAEAMAVLDKLLADRVSEIFSKPVLELWEEDELPGYFDVVKNPMDLGTVLTRVKEMEYLVEMDGRAEFDDATFFGDVRRVFKNAMIYNDLKSEYYRHARRLLAQADRKYTIRDIFPKPQRRKSVGTDGARSRPSGRTPVKRERDTAGGEADTEHAGDVRKDVVGSAAESAAVNRPRRTVVPPKAADEYVPSAAAGGATHPRPDGTSGAPATTPARGAPSFPAAATPPQKRASAGRPPKSRASGGGQGSTRARNGGASGRRGSSSKNLGVAGSSVSSDELELKGDVPFEFVSTVGMEKRRGRKSVVVQKLEASHDVLIRQRRILKQSIAGLENMKTVPLTLEEKAALCGRVAALDLVSMNAVVHIVARGMGREDMWEQEEVDMDINTIDNSVLREIMAYLDRSTVVTAHSSLKSVEEEIARIEAKLVSIRYQRA